jgi:hypothetical protein
MQRAQSPQDLAKRTVPFRIPVPRRVLPAPRHPSAVAIRLRRAAFCIAHQSHRDVSDKPGLIASEHEGTPRSELFVLALTTHPTQPFCNGR